MEQTLLRTEMVLREGRDRVQLLRDPAASTLDLPDALRLHAQDLAADCKVICYLDLPTTGRPIRPDAYEQILQIGREALTNAFRHSESSCVQLSLQYFDLALELVVADEGRGLKVDTPRGRHWGIQGMRERARMIRGELSFEKGTPAGTKVRLVVPAATLYSGNDSKKLAQQARNFIQRVTGMRPDGQSPGLGYAD